MLSFFKLAHMSTLPCTLSCGVLPRGAKCGFGRGLCPIGIAVTAGVCRAGTARQGTSRALLVSPSVYLALQHMKYPKQDVLECACALAQKGPTNELCCILHVRQRSCGRNCSM
eukprot:5139964-Amphidinium_carterae.1